MTKELVINARAMGKRTEAFMSFLDMGMKGEAVRYSTPKGDFLSPKAVENMVSKVEKIFGSHESPHTPSNCRLCRIIAHLRK